MNGDVGAMLKVAAAATASKISKNAPTSENPFGERENDLNAVTLPDEDNVNDVGTPKRVKSIPYKILSEDEVKNHGRTVTNHVGTLVSDEEESFSENSSESEEDDGSDNSSSGSDSSTHAGANPLRELGLESADVPARDVKTLVDSGAPVEY